jgi:hypothetical protein
MKPIVIRSEAQRLFLQKIARGDEHPSLSAEVAQAALDAHDGRMLPLRAENVVKANRTRAEMIQTRRMRGRG